METKTNDGSISANVNETDTVIEQDNDDVVVVDEYDNDAIKKALQTTIIKKKAWREKALKKDEMLRKLQDEVQLLKKKTETGEAKPEKPAFSVDSLAENLSVLRNLSDSEYSELSEEAKSLEIDPIKYIKSKSGQAHLKEIRVQAKSSDSVTSPSNKIPVFKGKPVNDIFTDPNASKEDKQAAFEEKMRFRRLNRSL